MSAHRFFYPDHAPTAELLSDLVFALAERSFAVTSPADKVMRKQTRSFSLKKASEASTSRGSGPRGVADCAYKVEALARLENSTAGRHHCRQDRPPSPVGALWLSSRT